MRLWSFLFTDPASPLRSARVAAPSKDAAWELLAPAAEFCVGTGVIVQYAGEVAAPAPAVVSQAERVPT